MYALAGSAVHAVIPPLLRYSEITVEITCKSHTSVSSVSRFGESLSSIRSRIGASGHTSWASGRSMRIRAVTKTCLQQPPTTATIAGNISSVYRSQAASQTYQSDASDNDRSASNSKELPFQGLGMLYDKRLLFGAPLDPPPTMLARSVSHPIQISLPTVLYPESTYAGCWHLQNKALTIFELTAICKYLWFDFCDCICLLNTSVLTMLILCSALTRAVALCALLIHNYSN